MPGALEALAEAGAHFVLCRTDKRPRTKAWQKTPAALEAARRHEGPVGVVPASLGCIVVDVDQGGEAAVDGVIRALGQPLARVPTRREGGEHLWYQCRDAEEVGNRAWRHGDIRGGRGYVILWDAESVAEGLADTSRPLADLNLADLAQLPPKANGGVEGERNDTLNRRVYLATRNGAPIEPHVAAAREAGLSEREIQATAESAKKAAKRDGARVFIENARTPAGLAAAFDAAGVGLRLNSRAKRYEYRIDGVWVNARDEESADLCRTLFPNTCSAKKGESVGPLTYGKDLFLELRAALGSRREVDPFLAWVEALPEWDGHPRIDSLLTAMFGAEDDELSRWGGRYISLGAIQRAYEPGCKLDEIPVLLGAQGCGKSAFVREWFTDDQHEWHGDGLDLSAKAKEQAEQMAGRVVVELSELAGMRRAEIERLKSFITRRDDGQFRWAYKRATETSPRRCVLVGTTNDGACLPDDPSGNRRFVVVELRHGCDVQAAASEREQWWAEALARYRQGERANLPRELMPKAAERAEEHRASDAMEDEVREALACLTDKSPEGFTMSDLHQEVAGVGSRPASKLDQMRYARALQHLKFSKQRVRRGGERLMLWVGPPPPVQEEPF